MHEDDNYFEKKLDKYRDRHDLEGRAQAVPETVDSVAAHQPALSV